MGQKRFAEAVSDCLRGLMRPGLDSTAADVFLRKLEHVLHRMEKIREMEAEDLAKDREKFAEQEKDGAQVAQEWKILLAEDEQVWQAIDNQSVGSIIADNSG